MKTSTIIHALEKVKLDAIDFDENQEIIDIQVSPTIFVRDGVVHVSGEDGRGFVDYYGEFRGGYPYIHPKLVEFAESIGYFWEWDNPGSISLYEK